MEKPIPDLFQYSNYREYLQDRIAVQRCNNAKYSYRYYAARSGFASSNFLNMVVKGQRNLTSESIAKIAKGFGLNKRERSYFEDLVLMNQAATHEEKDHYYQRMLRFKPLSEIKQIDQAHYAYFSKWYNPVIREILPLMPPPVDPDAVARLIEPPITGQQAQKAVRLLLSLGLIEENPTGGYHKKEAVLTTGKEVRSLQIANFHKQMARLADSAMDRFPSDQRDISGLVLSLNARRLPELKEKIEAFRNELAEMASQDTAENAVFYVQIRAFPLTKPLEEK